MNLALLLAWWNLVYVIPFGLALTYLALYVFTGITFGDGDADMQGEMDAGHVSVEAHVVDADADGDVDHDVDADHNVNAEADQDADNSAASGVTALAQQMEAHPHASVDGGGGASLLQSLLSLLGVGKIPFSLVVMILLLLWGSVGFVLNQCLVKVIGVHWIIGFISVPITAALSVGLTGLLARLMGRVLPTVETYVHKRTELVGLAGEAIYDIDATFGMATVRDSNGDMFQVPCRTATGKPPIRKGARVVLFDYDVDQGVFQVAPFAA